MWSDEFVKSYRMFDRWAQDTLPLAGEYFRQTTKDLMWDNKLYNGTMTVGGRLADISKTKVPVLHAVAEHDHIAVLRHGDGEPGFRDGVHRSAGDRHVQMNVAREPTRDVDLARHHKRVPRDQKHIVEGQRSGEVGDEVDGAELKD